MKLCQNHQHCIDQALINAHTICDNHGVRLTELRQQVLSLIWQSHKPLGAYALMDMLAEQTHRRVAPPTVYRALEFLLEQGLIHRINCLNAYIGCSNPHLHSEKNEHTNYFLICNQCHDTREIIDTNLTQAIISSAESQDFHCQQQWLEVTGLCQQCSES